MTENKTQSKNGYEAGREFYNRKIDELSLKSTTVKTPYEALLVQDEFELTQLQLKQLNRREIVLNGKTNQG